MNTRDKFDTIHDSIINGQFKQAYRQMEELSAMDALMDYFSNDLNNPELAIKAAKIYFHNQ